MADILPFVATRYNSESFPRLESLLTPPYDVIDKKMQKALYESSPHNLVRVDLGPDLPGDNEEENRYTRSGALWQQWKKDRVILEDHKKSFYVYEQEFALPDGRALRRRGFFAAVKLQDFSEGGIRAHEHTFEAPKADRFRLMRATNSNLSPIFCIYQDAEREVDNLLARGIAAEPDREATIGGVTHRLWGMSQHSVIQGVVKLMKDRTLFIADGHHRYETSLLYRDEMREALKKKNGRQPFDYTLIYMNNVYDEGLIILPTHRILSREISIGVDPKEVFEDLGEAFTITPLALDCEALGAEAARYSKLLAEAGRRSMSFIMILPKGKAFLLCLKEGKDVDELIDDEATARAIKELDVSILHQYIINRVWLGNPEIELDDQDVLYVKDEVEVLRRMLTSKCGVGFMVNPTRIEQVCRIASLGLRMPHKSTYFHPKLITGMVMRDMDSPW